MNSSNNQVQTDSDTPKYRPLSPQPNGENTEHYVEALDYAIGDKWISNIAITGSYGSGKSTIIETYIANNPAKNCLKISLAEFTDESSNGSNTDNAKEVGKQELEKSILQQLFYQRDAKDFPDSRFDRVQKRDPKKIGDIAIFVLVYFVFLALSLSEGALDSLITGLPLIGTENDKLVVFWKTVFYLLFICMNYFVVVELINQVKNIKKFNLKLETIGEIALDKQSDGSILNIYFDEIKYFFSESKIDVVFIEDFDRFKEINVELFTKLREINILLNASLKNSDNKSKKVNFVYALRDELFKADGERTKFFDFIIPVIPFVNYSNTGAKILEGLAGHAAEIDKNLVFELAQYISEMRLVHNIVNEFQLYLLNLKQFIKEFPELVTKEKLFAFIVYKNVFPADFSDLNTGKGRVYNLLQSTKVILEEATQDYRDKIEELECVLRESQEFLNRQSEDNKILLAAKVVEKIRTKNSSWNSFIVGNEELKKLSIKVNADLGDMLLKHDSLNVYNGYSQSTELSYKDELKDYKQNEHKKSLLDKRESIEAEIQNIRQRIEFLKGLELVDLLKEYPEKRSELIVKLENSDAGKDAEQPALKAIDHNQLLIKLVSEGYIDRNYHHYLTYYHSGSQLNLPDQRFIFHVKNRDMTHNLQEYDISTPEYLLIELKVNHFEHQSSWNISLVNYLLKSDQTSHLRVLVQGFKQHDESSLNFIRKYFNNKPNFELLVKHLVPQWPEIWSKLTQGQTKEWIAELLIKLLNDLDYASLNLLNKGDVIKHFIEEDRYFIDIIRQLKTTSRLQEIFKILDVKFHDLVFSTPLNKRAQEFFDIIVRGDFYQLNSYMLHLIISISCPQRVDELKKSQLSLLLEGECDIVRKRIKSDFDEYIESTYLALDTPQEDSEAFLLRLMNDNVIGDLSAQAKANILKKQSIKFSQISSVKNQDLWTDILAMGKVAATWENIARYFHYSELVIDETLLACLSDSNFVSELCKKSMNAKELDGLDEAFEGITKELNIKLVDEVHIPDDEYRTIIRCSYFRWSSYALTKLTPNKINILIDEKNLSVSQENLDGLVETGDDLAINFVKTNFDDVLKQVSEEGLSINDISFIKALMISDALSTEQRQQLFSLKLEKDEGFADAFVDILQDDIEALSFGLLEKLMQSENLSLDNKLGILATQMEFINDHNAFHKLFSHLGNGYEKVFTKDTGYVDVEKTTSSINLIHKIKSFRENWIGKTPNLDEPDSSTIRIYRRKLS